MSLRTYMLSLFQMTENGRQNVKKLVTRVGFEPTLLSEPEDCR